MSGMECHGVAGAYFHGERGDMKIVRNGFKRPNRKHAELWPGEGIARERGGNGAGIRSNRLLGCEVPTVGLVPTEREWLQ